MDPCFQGRVADAETAGCGSYGKHWHEASLYESSRFIDRFKWIGRLGFETRDAWVPGAGVRGVPFDGAILDIRADVPLLSKVLSTSFGQACKANHEVVGLKKLGNNG
jgi:hypothetical protein